MKQTPLYESLKMTYEREREIVNSMSTYLAGTFSAQRHER